MVLVVWYLAAGYEQYWSRLTTLAKGSTVAVAAYLTLFTILSASLLLAAFIRHPLARWCLAVAFAAAGAFWGANLRVTNQFLTYDSFVSEIDAFSFVNEAISHYRDSILWAALSALPLLLGIGLEPGRGPAPASPLTRRWQIPPRVVALAPAASLALLTAITFGRGGDGGRGLPAPFTPLAYVTLFGYEMLTQSVGTREPVRLPHTGTIVTHDIALIIDESVSGQYLDINSTDGVPTPLRHPPPDLRVVNYGYAASITNCSSGVNVSLRFGGTRQDYARMNARMPSIWQYARAAGLETVYIDAQRTHGVLVNRMTPKEMKDVDRWIQFNDVAVRDRDMAMAETLAALFADDTPQFIFGIKIGAHFPVHDKAPDEFVRYLPALPRGRYADVGDTESRAGFSGTVADWALYRNSYRNTLLWTVGEFFSRLLRPGTLARGVLLYTSDHGQDLHERGHPGLNTHCSPSPVMEEGLVPLVVLEGASLTTGDWDTHLEANRNRSSHYNIFPTLLQLMGYDLPSIRAVYGTPLTLPTNDPFTFNSRFNARLGTKPRWEFIDLERIMRPPPDGADGGDQ